QFASVLGLGRHRCALLGRLAPLALLVGSVLQFGQRLLLLPKRLLQVAFLQRLRRLAGRRFGLGRFHLLGLLGDVLLQLRQIRLRRLWLVGLFGILGGLLGLLQRLGDLLVGVHRIDFRLHRRLLGRFHALLLVERFRHRLLRFLQLLDRLVRVLRGRRNLLLIEIVLGGVHLLGPVFDVLGRLRRRLFQFLAEFLCLRRQLALLFRQVLGIRLLRLLRLVVGLLGDLAFLLDHLFQLAVGLLQLGDVVAALLGLGHLIGQRLLRLFELGKR